MFALIAYAALIFGSGALVYFDILEKRLPNFIVYPLMVAVPALLFVQGLVNGEQERAVRVMLAAVGVISAFFLLALLAPRGGFGLGDVKLSAVLGAALGWASWTHVILGMSLGFLLGGVWVGIGLLSRRVDRKGHVPFGPAMLAGAWAALLLLH